MAARPPVAVREGGSPAREAAGRPAPHRLASVASAGPALASFLLAATLALSALLPPGSLPRPLAGPAASLARSAHGVALSVDAHLVSRSLARRGDLVLARGPYRVLYPPGHEKEAELLALALARFAPPVFRDLGAAPPGQLTAVLAADGRSLDGELGLTGEAPVGAYFRGVVWVLAPSAWLGGSPEGDWSPTGRLGALFLARGPVAHELAHAALDRRLGRPAETWFDEGLAQVEDERQTGFVWREPANDFDQPLYSYEELRDEFDRLPNEALAYREAYALVRALALAKGGLGLGLALEQMAEGATADEAARAVLGPAYAAWRSGAAWSEEAP